MRVFLENFDRKRSLVLVDESWPVEGRKRATRTTDKAPAGALSSGSAPKSSRTRGVPYFKRNTHRQVVLLAMAPPRIGPRTLAMTKTEKIITMYLPYSFLEPE